MRIALLTPEYITEKNFDGGLANYLYQLSQALNERGHEIELFTASEHDGTFTHRGIMIHRLSTKRPFLKFIDKITRYQFRLTLHAISLSYHLRKAMLKRHNDKPFDIIQASSYMSPGFLFTFNRPTLIVTRVSSYEPLWRKGYRKKLTFDQRLIERFELLSLCRSDGVYAPSELLSHTLKEKEGIKVDIIRPPCSPETDSFDESIYMKYLLGRKYFLFFGTIGLLKGGEILAQALPSIFAKYQDMYFVFVGKIGRGPNGCSMMEYIFRKVGIYREKLIYIGVLKHHQLYPIIKHSQAVVLPSLIDNLPNVMLESMALGKIVIGTKGASFEEVIENGISGILVRPGNPKELTMAMERVWNMKIDEMERIGENAKKVSTLFSPQRTCSVLERYFENLLAVNRRL